jgi:hypothetical protein
LGGSLKIITEAINYGPFDSQEASVGPSGLPPTEESEYDWYRCTVQKVLSTEESLANVGWNVIVRFHKNDTNGLVPPRYNKDKNLVYARVPLPIPLETQNVTWALLAKTNLIKPLRAYRGRWPKPSSLAVAQNRL